MLRIIDGQRHVLHAHRNPAGDRYAETTTHRQGDQLALTLAPDIVVRLEQFFS